MDKCIIHSDLCHLGCFINREGCFQCVCNAGFKLSPEGRNCMGELRLYNWADCWCTQGSSDLEQVITIAVSSRGSAFHIAPSSYPFSVPSLTVFPESWRKWYRQPIYGQALNSLLFLVQYLRLLLCFLSLACVFVLVCTCLCLRMHMCLWVCVHVCWKGQQGAVSGVVPREPSPLVFLFIYI